MNDMIIFNEVMWALILSLLTFTAGLLLPELKKRKGMIEVEIEDDPNKVSYSKKLIYKLLLIPGLLYLPLELYIIFMDNGYSWAKEGPWWSAIFFVGLHIIAIWVCFGYGITMLSAILGLAVSFTALSIIASKKNQRTREFRSHMKEFRNEFHCETNREIEILNSWVD
ncbi:hypothetical protein IKW73_01975 [Candidatus Saccharibacteria bacterium]|nr:hypothetical protein [Candidatus Saccharibacteria bacterium]